MQQPTDVPTNLTLPVLGGCTTVAALAWISSGTMAGLIDSSHLPLYLLALAGGVTSTNVALALALAYVARQANQQRHAEVMEAVGQLAAQLEQVSARVEKINPIEIYAAVVEDILKR